MLIGLRQTTKQTQTFRLGQVVSLLKMSASELDALLSKMARENPMLVFRPRRSTGTPVDTLLEMTAVEGSGSLYQHVYGELAGLMSQGGLMEKVILALIEDLEPCGWIARPPREIARSLDISEELVEAALRVVQKRVDPPGLFARDLQDCLRLQLEDQDALTPDMACLLEVLDALEKGGIAGLAEASGMPTEKVRELLSVIQRLDPKPGNAFVVDTTLMREPDVRIRPASDGWEIEFLSRTETDLHILKLPNGTKTPELRAALAEARALKRALEIRASALKQVVRTAIHRQSDFFHHGPEALKPMTMSQIAQETGFHLSTVSRALNGLLIEGPNGIVVARDLFAGAASARSNHSKPMVQARIRAILSMEDPKTPLTDRRLTALLQSEGIMVSRRVVSTYRQEIGFLSPAKRRLRA